MTSTNPSHPAPIAEKQRSHFSRKWLYGLAGAGVLGLILYSLRPQPIAVDLAAVTRGELQVTIDTEGKTRVQDRFVIAAPVAGELRRISLTEGDRVDTQRPKPAALNQAQARIQAARAARQQAQAQVNQGESVWAQAERERDRSVER